MKIIVIGASGTITIANGEVGFLPFGLKSDEADVQVRTLAELTTAELFYQPEGAASAGFHVRHAHGSLDRLFTYARGESLSADQVAALRTETDPDQVGQVAAVSWLPMASA
mgnify:CR=1 FL=1